MSVNEAQQEAEAHAKEAEQTGGQPKQKKRYQEAERRRERAAMETSIEEH